MNSTEYKTYHLSYVSNNNGTTACHVFCCIFFMAMCTLFTALKEHQSKTPNIILEYFYIMLPLILAHTLLVKYLYWLIVIISLLTFVEFGYRLRKIKVLEECQKLNIFKTKEIQTISCLRGLTYLITVFAILAVDFKVFPKTFAKTERYGYSLMDTGVGLFTVMSGLVHKDLGKYKVQEIFKSNLKFVSILVILGIVRFWSVKALSYHEHVTEYGVHWNFFFTIAICKSLSTVLLYISHRPLFLSVLVLAIHEFLLYSGMQNWVFSDAPRKDLLSANREGISSCLGYTALYLFAVYTKKLISDQTVERYKILVRLTLRGLLCWVLVRILNMSNPISRVLANSTYCLYLSAIFLSITSVIYSFECLFQDNDKQVYFNTPYILRAINENGLVYFLLGNLLTGAVNLSIQTLFVSDLWSVIILNTYMCITLGLVVYLKEKGIKI